MSSDKKYAVITQMLGYSAVQGVVDWDDVGETGELSRDKFKYASIYNDLRIDVVSYKPKSIRYLESEDAIKTQFGWYALEWATADREGVRYFNFKTIGKDCSEYIYTMLTPKERNALTKFRLINFLGEILKDWEA